MKSKNFELFHEYQKRIVEELLEEFSNKGVTFLKDAGENANMYLAINGTKLLYTKWNGDIEVTQNLHYNQYNDIIGSWDCKYHRPKLDYSKFSGEVKAAFRKAVILYFDMVKRVKEQKIAGKIKELEKDFEEFEYDEDFE